MSFWTWLFRVHIGGTSRGRLAAFDIDQARRGWQDVQSKWSVGNPSNLKLAIIEADKIVDDLLKVLYPNQNTMADRLKLAKDRFTSYQTYQDLWYCHKVRNVIAHEVSYDLPSSEAARVLGQYQTILQELGVR